MQSLQSLMEEQLLEGGVMVSGGRDLHIEVIELATGRVWMTVEPNTQADYDALLEELDDSLRPVGPDHLRVLTHAGKEPVDGFLRVPFLNGLGLHLVDKTAKRAAARLRVGC